MLGPLIGSMATDSSAEPDDAPIAAVDRADPSDDGAGVRPVGVRPIDGRVLEVADDILGRRPADRVSVAVRVGDDVHELVDRPLVFGRRPDRDVIVVADGRVSRRHAAVERRAGTPVVVDAGSTNGTQLRRDGVTIVVGAEAVPLRIDDVILTIDGVVLGTVVAVPGRSAP
ncbi:MAG: FHA domain-containing protein [Ilumatobacter sp.]|nr:FHA domain-containing protein [Ilumatobacter sp.]